MRLHVTPATVPVIELLGILPLCSIVALNTYAAQYVVGGFGVQVPVMLPEASSVAATYPYAALVLGSVDIVEIYWGFRADVAAGYVELES